ncbi:MAG: Asd/ArgC dimerization domain-containing protein, partial [Colwellia sp.]
HHPEICQELNLACDQEVKLTFIPHLAPMIRGLLATLYAPVDADQNITIDRLQSIFEHRYADEPFVDVLPMGLLPATRDVKGSNKCEISVNYSSNTDTVVVFSSEDNLVKGASGQAIQNMNLMFELGETTGLESIALLP